MGNLEKRYGKDRYVSPTYLTLERWSSYFYQIEQSIQTILTLTKKSKKIRILEVGVGNKLSSICLTSILKASNINFSIKTVDNNPLLKPDILADIKKIPVKNAVFDLVLCFEVLEHLPFDDLPRALSELKRVVKHFVILSVPHNSIYCSFSLKLPKIGLKTLPVYISELPTKYYKQRDHYWELGNSNYPVKQFKQILISAGFKIIDEFRNPLYPYHHFFVLARRQNEN